MKKYRLFVSTLMLLALVSLNSSQSVKKKGKEPFLASIPQPIWQYDTGG